MTSRPLQVALLGGTLFAVLTTATALAAPVPATIRVEGSTQTLIKERNQAALATNVADRATGEVRTVGGPTALGQLIRAGASTRTPVRTSFTAAFGPLASLVERVGPDDQGLNFDGPGFWLFRVNHASSSVAANQKRLKKGDEVLWYFTSDFNAQELDLAVPGDPVRRGARFTVTVTAYDADGKGAPAKDARVAYSGTVRRTNTQGRATFTAKRGPRSLRATPRQRHPQRVGAGLRLRSGRKGMRARAALRWQSEGDPGRGTRRRLESRRAAVATDRRRQSHSGDDPDRLARPRLPGH